MSIPLDKPKPKPVLSQCGNVLGAASPAIQCRQIFQQNVEFVKFHKVPELFPIVKFVQFARNNYGLYALVASMAKGSSTTGRSLL